MIGSVTFRAHFEFTDLPQRTQFSRAERDTEHDTAQHTQQNTYTSAVRICAAGCCIVNAQTLRARLIVSDLLCLWWMKSLRRSVCDSRLPVQNAANNRMAAYACLQSTRLELTFKRH